MKLGGCFREQPTTSWGHHAAQRTAHNYTTVCVCVCVHAWACVNANAHFTMLKLLRHTIPHANRTTCWSQGYLMSRCCVTMLIALTQQPCFIIVSNPNHLNSCAIKPVVRMSGTAHPPLLLPRWWRECWAGLRRCRAACQHKLQTTRELPLSTPRPSRRKQNRTDIISEVDCDKTISVGDFSIEGSNSTWLDSTRHIRHVEPMHFGCVELVEEHSSTRSTRRARQALLAI